MNYANLICIDCKKAKTSSTITVKVTHFFQTLSYVIWGKDGKRHIHPGDCVKAIFTCSNGHSWTEMNYSKCSCGWSSQILFSVVECKCKCHKKLEWCDDCHRKHDVLFRGKIE